MCENVFRLEFRRQFISSMDFITVFTMLINGRINRIRVVQMAIYQNCIVEIASNIQFCFFPCLSNGYKSKVSFFLLFLPNIKTKNGHWEASNRIRTSIYSHLSWALDSAEWCPFRQRFFSSSIRSSVGCVGQMKPCDFLIRLKKCDHRRQKRIPSIESGRSCRCVCVWLWIAFVIEQWNSLAEKYRMPSMCSYVVQQQSIRDFECCDDEAFFRFVSIVRRFVLLLPCRFHFLLLQFPFLSKNR